MIRNLVRYAAVAALVVLWSAPSMALTADDIVIDRPVTDRAGVLSQGTISQLEARLHQHHRETGVQLAVLTVETTGEVPIEDFSITVAENWGGGSAQYDDGLLFTLAIEDRRNRIEVGYGLESMVPDGVAASILTSVVPQLREQDYDGATESVVDQLIAQTSGGVRGVVARAHGGLSLATILLLLFFIVTLAPGLGATTRRYAEDSKNTGAAIFVGGLVGGVIPLGAAVSILWIAHPSAFIVYCVLWILAVGLGARWLKEKSVILMVGGVLNIAVVSMVGLWIELGLQPHLVPKGAIMIFVSIFYFTAIDGSGSGGGSMSGSSSGWSSSGGGSSSSSFGGGGGSFGGGGASGSW